MTFKSWDFLSSIITFVHVVSETSFELSANQKQELPVVAIFDVRLGQNEESLQKTSHGCFLYSLVPFGQVAPEIFEITANQKQELPVAAIFVVRSGPNEENLYRTFHRCFLYSLVPFGHVVSETKIFEMSANQKQELHMTAIFVVRWGRNEETL